MNYFFILGRTPALSLLEISAALPRASAVKMIKTGSETALIEGPNDFRIEAYVRMLGGTVKGGRVIALTEKGVDDATAAIARDLSLRAERAPGRITFGLSAYSVSQKPLKGNLPATIQHIGITLKKKLTKTGGSARFVAPRRGDRSLSSVVVEKIISPRTRTPNMCSL